MEAGVANVYSETPKRRRERQKTVGLLSKTKTLQLRHAVWLFLRRHCSITTRIDQMVCFLFAAFSSGEGTQIRAKKFLQS